MHNKIAIIPARGGSKRIPKKNIIDFHGKPMIAWTIEAALQSEMFSKVIVSTDSPEIAEISQKFGAEVPFLRNHAYDDITPVSEAVLSALLQSKEYFSMNFEVVVQLMPNCPLRNASDIRSSLMAFEEADANYQISCFQYSWMNPWWAAKILDDGVVQPLFPEAMKKRSQDLPKLFCPTGAIWIAKTKSLLESNTFYGPDFRYYPINWMSAIDIDDYDDLNMAKSTFFLLNNTTKTKVEG